MLSREWRCSWSSADRRCSNCIWVIDNFIAYQGATYIRGFTVISDSHCYMGLRYPGTHHVVSVYHLEIRQPEMKSTGTQSSDELQWLHLKIGDQDSSSSNGRQGEMPYEQHVKLIIFLIIVHLPELLHIKRNKTPELITSLWIWLYD